MIARSIHWRCVMLLATLTISLVGCTRQEDAGEIALDDAGAASEVEPAAPQGEAESSPESNEATNRVATPEAPSDSDEEEAPLGKNEVWRLSDGFGPLYSVKITNDGSTMVAGTGRNADEDSGFVVVIDIESGKVIRKLGENDGHTGPVGCVALSPDDTQVLSGSWDKSIRLWDLETGESLHRFAGHYWPVLGIAIAPDGKQFLSCSDGVWVWDLESKKVVNRLRHHNSVVWSVAYSPDGSQAVSGSRNEPIGMWNTASGRAKAVLQAQTGNPRRVCFSPDGGLLATCSTNDPVVRIWDPVSGDLVHTLDEHTGGVGWVEFSEDGSRLLSTAMEQDDQGFPVSPAKDRTIRIWDVESGQELEALEGHKSYITSAAFLPDGSGVVSTGGDGTVRRWKLGI